MRDEYRITIFIFEDIINIILEYSIRTQPHY